MRNLKKEFEAMFKDGEALYAPKVGDPRPLRAFSRINALLARKPEAQELGRRDEAGVP